jgi:hypothetical protein
MGLQQGFLLVDAEARPLFVNRAGRELLDARAGLRLEASALSASDADGGRTLRRLIASCAAKANAGIDSGGKVALRRGEGRLPLDALVTPIQPETAMAASSWTFSQRAIEAAFALEIIKGDGRQATADRLGITVGTARSHLSRIFDKTGVRHQAELVRLLLQK